MFLDLENWGYGELDRAQTLLGTAARISPRKPPTGLEEEIHSSLDRLCMFANVTNGQRRRLKIQCASLVALAVVLASLFYSPLPLVFPLTYFGWVYGSLVLAAQRRSEDFERDYTAFLLSLASSVKTGQDPLSAMFACADLFREESVMRDEIKALAESVERGETEEVSIRKFATSVRHEDVKLFRTAFVLARQEGSSLAVCLRRLAKVTRQRQSFRRKVKGAVAMQRLSALGIAACAIIIGVIQWVTNPAALGAAFAHPTGVKVLTGGLFLIFAGVLWMLRISSPRF